MTLKVRLPRKQFQDDSFEEHLSGEFDILDGDKKVGRCVIAASKSGKPFELHLAFGSLESEKKLGFQDRQEVHLYGPVAMAFLRLVYSLGASRFAGSDFDSAAAALLAISTNDEDD